MTRCEARSARSHSHVHPCPRCNALIVGSDCPSDKQAHLKPNATLRWFDAHLQELAAAVLGIGLLIWWVVTGG